MQANRYLIRGSISNAYATLLTLYYTIENKYIEQTKRKKPMFITTEVMKKLPFRSFRKVAFLRARPLTVQDHQQREGIIATKEGDVPCEIGDYLARGISDEEWPIPAHFFMTNYQRISEPDTAGFCAYQALGTRQAFQMHTNFAIQYSHDTILTGKAGDYLVRSGEQVWITEGSIFEHSYKRA
jgi:hypothetical protein